MALFRRKKIIAVHYVNVAGLTQEKAQERVKEYKDVYSAFSNDRKVKEIFLPTQDPGRLEILTY